MAASPGGSLVHEKQKPTFSNNTEAVLGPARKKKKMTAFRWGSMPDNKLKCFVLAKSKNFMAFKVFSARRDKRTIVPSARLPFKFRKFDMSPSLTAEQLNAKLQRAQENRLRELERIRLHARKSAQLRGSKKDTNQRDDG